MVYLCLGEISFLAGHSVYRSAKENAFLLFFLIFRFPKVKEVIALVINPILDKGCGGGGGELIQLKIR